ncbi:tRNA (adenosine(37)-N6)-threonylcarbamoyltransferase complex transferase subunit TsaD, partial [Lentibacillus sp. N15]
RLASIGAETIAFPRAWLDEGSYDFSFSGLKSSVINTIHNAKQRGEELKKEDIAASFQASVIEVLTEKTFKAAIQYGVKQVIVAGGVAANKGLRTALDKRFANSDIPLLTPPLKLCTDNAAMIGAAGAIVYEKGERAGWDLNARPGMLLS